MTRQTDGFASRNAWRALFALVAIAVVLLGTTAVVAHGHAPGQATHDGCSLCLTTHAVIAVVVTLTLAVQQRSAPLRPRQTRLAARRTAECPCWNRPPPVR